MKLIVTLEIDVSDMTDDQLKDAGWEDFDNEGSPRVAEYDAREIADLIPNVLNFDDVKAEMFAGSDIFANFDKVRVRSASYEAA